MGKTSVNRVGDLFNGAYIMTVMLVCQTREKTEEQLFLRWLRMSKDRQLEGFKVALQCLKPSLQWWMHTWELGSAKTISTDLQRAKLIWSVTFFSTSGRVLVSYTPRERYWPEHLTPTVGGFGGCFAAGGHSVVMVWVHLEGRVSANRYKVVLYPIMKHFYPEGSGLFRAQESPIRGCYEY